ncbi:MAG: serine/threonine-protein kinase [Planctomycetota bacterium]
MSERTNRIVAIVDEYLAERRRGAAPDRSALIRRHPAIAEELDDCLRSIELVEHGFEKDQEAVESFGGMLGDFRIFREVGRGGMGVVYEAEQVSLARRVALKVLPLAATFDERHRQRFRNEAQAAAYLHHAGIVPVHAVGCERGVHFYAMQFIDGRSLAQIVEEVRALDGAGRRGSSTDALSSLTDEPSPRTSGWCQVVARLGVQAAEALDHAHERGVVHRDIKPANLLVDAYARVWVTDFGLASFTRSDGVTLTGDLMGTMRYMSPEQALAKRAPVDHRTDIYSLGVTLYELLTLTPAFPGEDPHELMRAISERDPAPPSRLNSSIPADLETIVLKATQKDPQARYSTAQAFAHDLRLFLENRPIVARRPPAWNRVRRWAHRHRTMVSAAVALLLLATAGLATATVLLSREQRRVSEALTESEQHEIG